MFPSDVSYVNHLSILVQHSEEASVLNILPLHRFHWKQLQLNPCTLLTIPPSLSMWHFILHMGHLPPERQNMQKNTALLGLFVEWQRLWRWRKQRDWREHSESKREREEDREYKREVQGSGFLGRQQIYNRGPWPYMNILSIFFWHLSFFWGGWGPDPMLLFRTHARLLIHTLQELKRQEWKPATRAPSPT